MRIQGIDGGPRTAHIANRPEVATPNGRAQGAGPAYETRLSPKARMFLVARSAYLTSAARRAAQVEVLRERAAAGVYQVDRGRLADALLDRIV